MRSLRLVTFTDTFVLKTRLYGISVNINKFFYFLINTSSMEKNFNSVKICTMLFFEFVTCISIRFILVFSQKELHHNTMKNCSSVVSGEKKNSVSSILLDAVSYNALLPPPQAVNVKYIHTSVIQNENQMRIIFFRKKRKKFSFSSVHRKSAAFLLPTYIENDRDSKH